MFNEISEAGPSILSSNECKSLVNAEVPRDRMIMTVLQYTEVKRICILHVDTSVKPNEAMGILRPPRGRGIVGIVKVFFGDRVMQDSCEDVLVKFLDIHKNDTMHDRMNEVSSADRHSKLLQGKDRFKIVWIYHGIVATPPL